MNLDIYSMAHFSEQVHITIGGFTQNIIYYDLKLSQKMADHHYFSFVWQYTGKAVIKPADQAKAMKDYIGNEVIFTFKSLTGIKLMSKGIITGLTSIDQNGSAVGLHVSGTSHSIVLDDNPKSRTYLERGMDDIVLDILSEGPTEFYQRDAIRSTCLKEFKYMAQYNETSFDFLKRLAHRYGQWFYFDGMRMQFGQIKTSKIKLINGASLHSFKIQANMSAHKISLTGYDYNKASSIKNSSLRTSAGSKDSFASNIGFNQGTVAQPDLSIGAYTNNAQNKDEIDEMVTLQTAGSDANSVYYSGISYFPIGLGQVFTIINDTTEHHLICIEATHHSEVHGNYTCEFKAIPDDVSAPHYTDTKIFAKAETQPAKIKDNNDPEGLGRVRVEFYWGNGSTKSQWMRVVQNYAGPGRGSYWRPEIDDEVLVSFEGGNAQNPYVMGAHYNGQAKPEFFDPNNLIKAIRMRFGQLLKFVEKTGIWLSDPSGNEIHLNEETKSTTITVPETLTLNCKNLIINASESITTTAGLNILESAGVDKSTTVGMVHNLNIGGDNLLNVEGSHFEDIKGNIKSNTEKDRKIISKEKIIVHSTEDDVHVKASKNLNNYSGENTKAN
ncbi:phage baseplate assembly protein V [Flavobacterium sp. LHD-80]|uniref:type VI secretion system Vgr family protein n=1 Tax=Flavobacterium sp. LHD-80 TaxID=3071411 RepID=UPI0027DF4222|nr:phage baseplate assembly protein V [Flavobacterium sp. LHD-80]MDQ6472680.1 phage baseplate assembly protein V [Flavobacterium sp. LHD-80]